MTSAISILLFLAILFLRALPRFCVNRGKLFLETSDTWYHLMLAEEIRQNHHRLPARISKFLLSEGITYPPLFHILLSYLNREQRTALEPFLGGFFDGLVGVILFLVADLVAGLDVMASVFTALLFVFSPYALGLSFGPRTALGTARVFGQFLFFLAVLLLLQYLHKGVFFYGLAAMGLGSLIFLASMFTSQAYVFILVILSLLLPSARPLIILCGSYLLSILLSRGHTLKITQGHILHLMVMAKTFWKGRFLAPNIQQRNRLGDLLQLPGFLFTDLKQVFFLFYVRNTFLIVLFQIPVMTFYLYVRIGYTDVRWGEPVMHLSDTLLISGLLVFLAVSGRTLLFLGEAERYVEHIAPFTCLFIGMMLPLNGSWTAAYALLFYSIGLYVVNVTLFVYQFKVKNSVGRQRDTQALLDWINKEAPQKRFAVFPQTGLNILIAYLTSASVLFGRWKDDSSPAVKSLKAVESEEFRQYRSGVFQQYVINYIIIPGTAPVHQNLLELKTEFPVVFQNELYCVLLLSGRGTKGSTMDD